MGASAQSAKPSAQGKRTLARQAQLDEAKRRLDVSAEKNRNLLIAFMAYLATATILCLSVTDLDLLVDEKTIPLPLLSVGLPMWAFYTVIPLILLLLHFDVLHNVQEHRRKLEAWLQFQPPQPGEQLFPYLLDFARVRYGGATQPSKTARLVAAGAWLIYAYLPSLVLVVFFVRFADLQGLATTAYHLTLWGLDIALLWLFWQKLRPLHQQRRWWQRIPLSNVAHWAWLVKGLALLWVLLLWLCIQALHFSGPWLENHFQKPREVQEANRWTRETVKQLRSRSQNILRLGLGVEKELQGLGRIAIVPRLTLANARPYQVKDDDIRLAKWLNPGKTEQELWEASPRPMDLQERRLAYADLSHAQLRRVNLVKADLQGANFSLAQLQGADLSNAQLQGADLSNAQLQGAYLFNAQLQGANLRSARLQGADLSSARLQGADLWSAQLQGTYLWDAQLQGADLRFAQLQGAYLKEAQLQGADLTGAQLQGADLSNAQLQGTYVRGAEVLGVQWPEKKQIFWATKLDHTREYDFEKANLPTDKYVKERIQRAKERQQHPPPVPQPLGTQDPQVFKQAWLAEFCQQADGTKSMLWRRRWDDHLRKLIPLADLRDYIANTERCAPYRAMAQEYLDE